MIVIIKDRATLAAIRPARVAAYLQATHWKRMALEAGRYSIWVNPSAREPIELLLPLDAKFDDFAERMAELLHDLQKEEERSQIDILRDIELSSCDVFRFRKDPRSSFLGTIPIEDGVRFVTYARDMLLLAASAEHDPERGGIAGRRSDDVTAFMSQALLGQTEISSFVVTAQVPVTARLNEELFPDEVPSAPEPFERRAGVRMMNLLGLTREAALEVSQTNDIQPFVDALAQGATISLYNTLVDAQSIAPGQPLEVSCTWAPSRPLFGKGPPKTVLFEPEIVLPIRAAVEKLRARVPREGERIVGFVEVLQQPAQEVLFGELAVTTLIDGKPRKVFLILQEPEYSKAIVAFKEKQPIEIKGDLIKAGKRWTLQNPRDLVLYPGERASSDEEEGSVLG